MTAPGTIRDLKHLLGVLGALPLFVLAGTLAAIPFVYGFQDEEVERPSGQATVIGVWDDPELGPYCRAFTLLELQPHLSTISVRFLPTDSELAQCRQSISSYDRETGWLRELPDGERSYEGFGLDVEEGALEPVFTVRRFHGDGVSTTTRYTVTQDGTLKDLETKSTSSGAGVTAIGFGGGAGLLGWCLWILWLIGAAIRRRVRGS